MRWRVITNEWNLKHPPWTGAIGIEVDDDSVYVPAVVCWFTRGWNGDEEKMAQQVVDQHNAAL